MVSLNEFIAACLSAQRLIFHPALRSPRNWTEKKSLFFSFSLHCHIHWVLGSLWFYAVSFWELRLFSLSHLQVWKGLQHQLSHFVFVDFLSHTWLDRIIKHIHIFCNFLVTKLVIVLFSFFSSKTIGKKQQHISCPPCGENVPSSVAWWSSIGRKSEAF